MVRFAGSDGRNRQDQGLESPNGKVWDPRYTNRSNTGAVAQVGYTA
jgi:hypothetical protein